jgi:hypothetical protein
VVVTVDTRENSTQLHPRVTTTLYHYFSIGFDMPFPKSAILLVVE